METEPTEGEKLFERLRLLKFPSLAPVRYKESVQLLNAGQKICATEMEAIMRAGYWEPETSQELLDLQQRQLQVAVFDMFYSLTEEEQWIYHMLVDVGLSMRFVAKALDLPKTTFARRRDSLAEKMRRILLNHEIVRDRLGF
tara:strand:+ start:8850 stop:9275 length:426 start_codon:yes stop_codon:yes gene_type:complete